MHDIAMAALSVFHMPPLAFLAWNTCGPSAYLRAIDGLLVCRR